MRGFITKFKQWKKGLCYFTDSVIKWIFNKTLFSYTSYKKDKQRIDSLEELKIQDNSKHIDLIKKTDRMFYLFWLGILVLPYLRYFMYFKDLKVTENNLVFSIISFILMIMFTMFFVYSLIKFIESTLYFEDSRYRMLSKYFSLLPLISITLVGVSIIILLVENGLKIDWKNSALVMILILISLWLNIRRQSIFQLEMSTSSLIITLAILAIIRIFDNRIEAKLLFVFITILGWLINFEVSKRKKVAQKIFEKQLLLSNPDYEELKKCYYYGGEKYKEKILSTEKFLRLIKQREIYNINYKRRRRKRRKMNEKKWINGI